MIYIVGSGPAGAACAIALLSCGQRVTMLDAGLRLEPEKRRHVDRLASTEATRWPLESIACVKSGMQVSERGIPLKYVFGSDFPFRIPPGAPRLLQKKSHALRSFALGGLSQAWGATLLPFVQTDINDWPISVSDLAPHYREVMKWVPLSAAEDGLNELFPAYADQREDLQESPQAKYVLLALSQNREALQQEGLLFGRARLAVRVRDKGGRRGCVYCGMCLYGCPYGCIHNSEQTLEDLRTNRNFTYIDGVLVRSAKEDEGSVRIEALDIGTGQPRSFTGERVFLACGVLTTTQILMDSLNLRDSSIRIPSSQSFLCPMVSYKRERGPAKESAHTLSQVYLALQDPSISRHIVQLQIYTYSDLITGALRRSPLGLLFRLFPALESAAVDRLVVLQGLLHSHDSDPLTLQSHSGPSEGMAFSLHGALSRDTKAKVRGVGKKLYANRRRTGLVPLIPLVRISSAGQSFHTGGSFPMSASPGPRESDLLGRPGGLRRVHAVDASVFPSVPSVPLTLSVMANAHRIASQTVAELVAAG